MNQDQMQKLVAHHTDTCIDDWQSFNHREFDKLRQEGVLFYNHDTLDTVLVAPVKGVWQVCHTDLIPDEHAFPDDY